MLELDMDLNRFSTLVTYNLTLKFEHKSPPHTFCHICMCIMMKESSFKSANLSFLSYYHLTKTKISRTIWPLSTSLKQQASWHVIYKKLVIQHNSILIFHVWKSWLESFLIQTSKMIAWSCRKSNVQLNYT
jgi:hypothetical protein